MDEPIQQSVEELLRPMSAQSDGIVRFGDAAATSPAVEFSLAVAFALFSPLVVDLPLGAITRHSGPGDGIEFIAFTLAALAGVRLGLLAIWLAWGQSRAVWRLPVVLPSAALSAILWTGGRREAWQHVVPVAMFIFLGTALAAAAPRLFGVYRINLFDPPPDSADGEVHDGQFRLIDMFAWTATAAVLAGLMRWIGLPRDYDWVGIIIFVPIGSLLVLSAQWATLAKREVIAHRVLAAFGVAFGIAMILCAFVGRVPEAIFYICYTLMLATGLLLGALYIVRCLGVRLVTRWLPLIAPPATATTPTGTAAGKESPLGEQDPGGD